MKNTIFKSYAKKILKSEAFISVVIVFVLALGIIGTSYALYMDVDTDTEYELVEVGDLKIGFDNGDNTISLENMTPTEDSIALTESNNIFSFYIYNTGTYTADYDIKLETTDGNEIDTQYINYQICKDNARNCNDINTLSNVDNSIVYKDILLPKKENDVANPSVYYFLRIWINNKYTEKNTKNIKLKVVVDAKNANSVLDNKNTLSGSILNNKNIKVNNTTPDLNKIEANEKGLYKTKDNYGVSYYFRGNSSYNYVIFNNMCYRVYRIEGDGASRLILSNKNGNCNKEDWNIGDTSSDNESVNNEFLLSLPKEKLKDTNFCTSDNEKPTLICDDNNKKTSYVGSITKDELIFAGILVDISNNSSYLDGNYWLMTSNNNTRYGINNGKITLVADGNLQNRPVISLNAKTLISSGNGTQNNPYIIK